MPKTAFSIEIGKPPEQHGTKTRNQWHSDIPMAETFKSGGEFRVECHDCAKDQITNDGSANDIRDADSSKVHYLGTPFDVAGTICASHTAFGL